MTAQSLKEEMEKKAGEPLFYIWEIAQLIGNLGTRGRNYSEETIRRHLNGSRMLPADYGINAMRNHGIDKGLLLYSGGGVWDYLCSLEVRGKIALRERGISSIDELLEQGFQLRREPYVKKRGKRRNYGDNWDGGWDNVVGAIER